MKELVVYSSVAGELVNIVQRQEPRCFVAYEQAIEMQDTIKTYESLLHAIDLACLCQDNEKVKDLIMLIRDWSYSHRSGNGEKSDKQVEESIERAFQRIKEVVG